MGCGGCWDEIGFSKIVNKIFNVVPEFADINIPSSAHYLLIFWSPHISASLAGSCLMMMVSQSPWQTIFHGASMSASNQIAPWTRWGGDSCCGALLAGGFVAAHGENGGYEGWAHGWMEEVDMVRGGGGKHRWGRRIIYFLSGVMLRGIMSGRCQNGQTKIKSKANILLLSEITLHFIVITI